MKSAETVIGSVAVELQGFGGFLRCETCGIVDDLGNAASKLSRGWPKCHGYTMRWWTQRQIDAGEVPDLVSR